MSFRFRRTAKLTAALSLLALARCVREERDFRTQPPGATAEGAVQTSGLHAGPPAPDVTIISEYELNAWAVSEGKRLYDWMNCSGCHAAGGGGGIGPALTDNEWIYGADPENIFDTIVKGRPRGMPSFRGRLDNADVWKLVAYVRQLGGFVREDAESARTESLSAADRNQRGDPTADSSRIKPEQKPPRRGDSQ